MSLGQLRREMTYEELYLWIAYLGLKQDIEEEAMQKQTQPSIELTIGGFFCGRSSC